MLKKISGFPDYYITDDGRVWSDKMWRGKKGRWLAASSNSDGYSCVRLFHNGNHVEKKVHRLVAEAFLPNPNNLPIINHKDENKSNNSVNNLEWCTVQYNVNYGTSYSRGRIKTAEIESKAVLQFTIDGMLIAEYESTHIVADKMNVDQGGISKAARGKFGQSGHKAYGYLWYYLQDIYDNNISVKSVDNVKNRGEE